MANWPDQNDLTGFTEFANRYTPPDMWVPAGQPAPPAPPDVPPKFLREVAIKSLTPPTPELDWNPRRIVNQGTLVNLDT